MPYCWKPHVVDQILFQSESFQKQPDQYGTTDDDQESVTLTIQTGVSSGFRTNNLSRLSRHSVKIKTSSSFPNLLSLYQEPIREEVIFYYFIFNPFKPNELSYCPASQV